MSWRWHHSRRRGDCSRVLTLCIQATSLKGAQEVLWRVAMSLRARCFFFPTHSVVPGVRGVNTKSASFCHPFPQLLFLLQHQSPRCPRPHQHSPHNYASCVDSQYTSYRARTALVKANNDRVGCLRWRKATSDESINETDATQMHPSMEANAPPLPPMQQFTCRACTPARS